MECTWFFGADLRTSAILISLLGIVHPAFWVVAAQAQRFRSKWFLALYVLTGAWSLVSCLMFFGILAKLEVLSRVWIWFSLVFAPLMALGMALMAVGFLILRMRCVALCPAAGLIYYILTLYCICVVNTQRRAAYEPRAGVGTGTGAGSDRPAGRSAAVLRLAPETTTTGRWTFNPPRRGRCAVPEKNPPNGIYMAALHNNRVARPGRQYHRLRLWVYCDKFYRPRHLQYAFCYAGGWNLPLPDCVKDASYYQEYYDDYLITTTTEPTECVLPPPPEHGYFTRESKITRRYMQLSVRCNSLHLLVGWQRITCHDGVWNRPVPNCVFVDSSVCTLVSNDNRMIRTCLSSALYDGTYRCQRGIVPHGTVVEPSCPRRYYVWGPFNYLFCVNGIWHPRELVYNIACEHEAEIYRHYEMEDLKNKTKMATAAPVHDVREQDSVRHADTVDSSDDLAADAATIIADPATDPAAKTPDPAANITDPAADAATTTADPDPDADPDTDTAAITVDSDADLATITADPVTHFAANTADPAVNTAATANQTHRDSQLSGAGVLLRTKVSRTTHQVISFRSKIDTTDTWKAENITDVFLSSNTSANIKNVWATQEKPSDLLSTSSNINTISKYQREPSSLPITHRISTSRRKLDITDIWKGPIDAEETTDTDFLEKSTWSSWSPLPVGALIDNLIKPDKESAETGALSDTKLAKVHEWPSQRDRDWFSPDAVQSIHETEDVNSVDDKGINLNIRHRDEPLSSTWKSREAIQKLIWKSGTGDTDELRTISNIMRSRKSRKITG